MLLNINLFTGLIVNFKNSYTTFFLSIVISLTLSASIFAKKLEVVNGSKYPILIIYNDYGYTNTGVLLSAKTLPIEAGKSAAIELSDKNWSTVYAYRVSLDKAIDFINNRDQYLAGLNNISAENLSNIDMGGITSLVATIKTAYDKSPIRYLNIDPAKITDESQIYIGDYGDSSIQMAQRFKPQGKDEWEIITKPTLGDEEEENEATKRIVELQNNSKFPVLVAYGKKTWGDWWISELRLATKAVWWKYASFQYIPAESTTFATLDDNDKTRFVFYRISPEHAINNITALTKGAGKKGVEKAILNVVPGPDLVKELLSVYQTYEAITSAFAKVPFTTATVPGASEIDNCSKIIIETTEEESSIKCNLEAKKKEKK
jgi:hypothetical protein